MLLMNMSQFANHGYAVGSARMGELKLLQRFVAALATNEGVQSKRREILQRLKSLSPREVDVLCYVLGGQLNREIAAELGLGLRTIKAHRGSLMKKLGVRSTAQLFPMVWRVLGESGCKIFYKPRRQVRGPNLRTKVPSRRSNHNRPVRVELKPATFSV
jgi:DNA-binding CsgD family transcriptional regulator